MRLQQLPEECSSNVRGCACALCDAEKYLREVWPAVTRALKEMGVGCELNLVSHCSGWSSSNAEMLSDGQVPVGVALTDTNSQQNHHECPNPRLKVGGVGCLAKGVSSSAG